MSLLGKFIVVLFAVFLHHVRPIGVRAVRKHHYHLCWSKRDAVLIEPQAIAEAASNRG